MSDKMDINQATSKLIQDSDGRPDFTEGFSYKKALKIAAGAKYDNREELRKALTKDSFWDRLTQTLRGQNKVGRAIHTAGIIAVSLFTGINIEPLIQTINQPTMIDFLTDFNIWGAIGALAAILLGYLKTITGSKLDSVIDDANSGLQLYTKFKQKESEGGQQVTDGEKNLLIEHFAGIFEKQAKKNI